MNIGVFRKLVLDNYRSAAREFPWRNSNPWGVMISEFMLQQTQTTRVIQFWEKWMRLWPGPQDLAKASLAQALREWSGLGYNNRCVNLKKCAAIITADYGGRVPDNPKSLLLLPGIGPYCAGAISCFAYNYPAVFIETNIRSAVIHYFFTERNNIRDSEIFPILEKAIDRKDPRTWNYALMDLGAAIKKSEGNPGRRSAHYTVQSAFIGSFRQARGKVIRTLAAMGPCKANEIGSASGLNGEKLYSVLEKLEKESLIAEKNGIYRITS